MVKNWVMTTNKKVEVKYIKPQDQIANSIIKPFKYDVFAKIRDILRVIKKSSLRGMLKANYISS
jgi:hypothetical protein